MPILADALQDAGCEVSEMLGHLRGSCTLADWSLWNLLGLDLSEPDLPEQVVLER